MHKIKSGTVWGKHTGFVLLIKIIAGKAEGTMETRRKSVLLLIAAGLIFSLGIIRGVGGLINLLGNENTLESLNNSIISFTFLVVGFIVLSAATFITVIAVFKRNKKYFLAGIFLTLIFVFSGAVIIILLFDVAKELGIIIDIIAAVFIISILIVGKKALEKTEKS